MRLAEFLFLALRGDNDATYEAFEDQLDEAGRKAVYDAGGDSPEPVRAGLHAFGIEDY